MLLIAATFVVLAATAVSSASPSRSMTVRNFELPLQVDDHPTLPESPLTILYKDRQRNAGRSTSTGTSQGISGGYISMPMILRDATGESMQWSLDLSLGSFAKGSALASSNASDVVLSRLDNSTGSLIPVLACKLAPASNAWCHSTASPALQCGGSSVTFAVGPFEEVILVLDVTASALTHSYLNGSICAGSFQGQVGINASATSTTGAGAISALTHNWIQQSWVEGSSGSLSPMVLVSSRQLTVGSSSSAIADFAKSNFWSTAASVTTLHGGSTIPRVRAGQAAAGSTASTGRSSSAQAGAASETFASAFLSQDVNASSGTLHTEADRWSSTDFHPDALGCILDSSTGSSSSGTSGVANCTIPMPPGVHHFRVRLSGGAASTGTLSVNGQWMLGSSASSLVSMKLHHTDASLAGETRSVQCSWEAEQDFTAAQGGCGSLASCTHQLALLPSDGSSNYNRLEILVQQDQLILENTTRGGGGTCLMTLGIVVELFYDLQDWPLLSASTPARTTAVTDAMTASGPLSCTAGTAGNRGGFACPSVRQCVPSDAVMDSTKDCGPVAEDEVQVLHAGSTTSALLRSIWASGWTLLERHAVLTSCTSTSLLPVTPEPVAQSCLAAAAAHLETLASASNITTVFQPQLLGIDDTSCEFYDSACVAGLVAAAPLTFTSSLAQTALFVYAGGTDVPYCSRSFSCSDRGSASAYAVPSTYASVLSAGAQTSSYCLCTCDAGYAGAHCEGSSNQADRDGLLVVATTASDPATILQVAQAALQDSAIQLSSVVTPPSATASATALFRLSTSSGSGIRSTLDRYGNELTLGLSASVAGYDAFHPTTLGLQVLSSSATASHPNCATTTSGVTTTTCEVVFSLSSSVYQDTMLLTVDVESVIGAQGVSVTCYGAGGSVLSAATTCSTGSTRTVAASVAWGYLHSGQPRSVCTLRVPTPTQLMVVSYAQVTANGTTTSVYPELRIHPEFVTATTGSSIASKAIVISEVPRGLSFMGMVGAGSLALVTFVLMAMCLAKDSGLKNEMVTSNPPSKAQKAQARKYPSIRQQWRWSFRTIAEQARYDDDRCCCLKWDRCFLFFGLVCMLSLVSGGLFAFFNTYNFADQNSSYVAMLEVFDDAACTGSAYSPTPSRTTFVEAHARCTESMHSGEVLTTRDAFLSVACKRQSSGSYQAHVASGRTLLECRAAREVSLATGGCDAITPPATVTEATLLKPISGGYMRVTCIDAREVLPSLQSLHGQTDAYYMQAGRSIGNASVFTVQDFSGAVTWEDRRAAKTQLAFGADTVATSTASTSSVYTRYWYVTSRGDVGYSSAAVENRLLSRSLGSPAVSAISNLDLYKHRYVVSHLNSLFHSGSVLRLSEDDNWPSSDRYLPTVYDKVDLPIGYFFNGYGEGRTSSSSNGNVAEDVDLTGGGRSGLSATEHFRYPNAFQSSFDIGHQHASGAAKPTLSFWIKPGPTTRGFAVAVMDDWTLNSPHDPTLLESPILHRLFAVAERGAVSYEDLVRRFGDGSQATMDKAGAWFDHTWHAYLAVYLDAGSNSISVITTQPGRPILEEDENLETRGSNTVGMITFNFGELGVQRFFTNTWRHVSFHLNADRTVQIFIDAQTSFSAEGWTRCLPFNIPAITQLNQAPMLNPKYQGYVSSPNATILVGALNAGMFGVEVSLVEKTREEIASDGTLMMRNFYRFSSAYHTALAFYMLSGGLFLLLIMVIGVIQEFVEERTKKNEEDRKRGSNKYAKILDWPSPEMRFAKMENTGKIYPSLSYDSAKDALRLSAELFASVLEEIDKLSVSEDGGKGDLMALLWTQGRGKYKPLPAGAETFERWKNKESGELSSDGHFLLPEFLWSDFVKSVEGGSACEIPPELLENNPSGAKGGHGKVAGKGARNLKGLKAGKGAKGAKGGGGGGSGEGTGVSMNLVVQMLLPVTMALQSMSMYMTSFNFPTEYLSWFTQFFSWVSLDFLSWFPGLPVLAGPVVTLAVGFLVVILSIWFTVTDHGGWLKYAARYVQRRDVVDLPKVHAEKCSQIRRTRIREERRENAFRWGGDGTKQAGGTAHNGTKASMAGGLAAAAAAGKMMHAGRHSPAAQPGSPVTGGHDDLPPEPIIIEKELDIYDYMMPMFRYVLPQKVAVAIDQYVDESRASNVVKVQQNDLLPAEVAKRGVTWEIIKGKGSEVRVGVHGDTSGQSVALHQTGFKCPMHVGRHLTEVEQTNCKDNPFECFVVQHGERCINRVGKVFACQKVNKDGTHCPYALCADHCRTSVLQYLKLTVIGIGRIISKVGFGGAIAFAILALSAVVYFPVMQICFRFLTCDPQYQCYFERCWSNPDRNFLTAACIIMINALFVGIILPIVLYRELSRRQKILNKAFHSPAYLSVYMEVDEDAEEEFDGQEVPAWRQSAAFSWIKKFSPTAHSHVRVPQQKTKPPITHQTHVAFSEWERFLVDDNSDVYMLYMMLEYEWMTFPPMVMLYKLLLLTPTLFFEANTFEQLLASSGVELAFGLFIFWSAPYVNPWIDYMYKAGSVHNVTLLGLTAMHRVLVANGDPAGLTQTMMITTATYLCFVAILLLVTIVWPMIAYGIGQIQVESQMNRIGLRTNDLSSLFLNPLVHEQPEAKEEERDPWEDGFAEGVIAADVYEDEDDGKPITGVVPTGAIQVEDITPKSKRGREKKNLEKDAAASALKKQRDQSTPKKNRADMMLESINEEGSPQYSPAESPEPRMTPKKSNVNMSMLRRKSTVAGTPTSMPNKKKAAGNRAMLDL